MAKQVPLTDYTNEELESIVEIYKQKTPHITPTKKGVIAELVHKELTKLNKGK